MRTDYFVFRLSFLHYYLPVVFAVLVEVAVITFYFSFTSGDNVVGFLFDDAIYLLMTEL